jgi:hypothetical protein
MNRTEQATAISSSLKERARAAIAATNHIGKVHANGAPNNSNESTVEGMTAMAKVILPAYKAAYKTLVPR